MHCKSAENISSVTGISIPLAENAENVRPFLHMEPRPSTSRKRSKVKSTIYTDTTVRNQIQQNVSKVPMILHVNENYSFKKEKKVNL